MSDLNTNTPAGKSLGDIAQMMADARKQMRPDDDAPAGPAEEREDVVADDQEEVVEAQADEPAEEAEELVAADEDEVADEEADEADTEAAQEDFAEFELNDDDLIEVGDEEISFATLKEVYNANQTIKGKIEEAEAARMEASQQRARALEEHETLGAAARDIFAGLQEALATPLVGPPNDAMKTTNPNEYIQHLEAYQADQQRIQNQTQAFQQLLQKHAEAREETLKQSKAQEMSLLTSKLPGLKDENTRAAIASDIIESARHYGFSDQEIDAGHDHRLRLMAYDAMQYRKSQQKVDPAMKETQEKTTRKRIKTKTLRSGATNAGMRTTSQQKRVKTVKNAAMQSGKTGDVAAFMSARRNAT